MPEKLLELYHQLLSTDWKTLGEVAGVAVGFGLMVLATLEIMARSKKTKSMAAVRKEIDRKRR